MRCGVIILLAVVTLSNVGFVARDRDGIDAREGRATPGTCVHKTEICIFTTSERALSRKPGAFVKGRRVHSTRFAASPRNETIMIIIIIV